MIFAWFVFLPYWSILIDWLQLFLELRVHKIDFLLYICYT